MTVYAITDTKKGRTWIAPTYLQTTHSMVRCINTGRPVRYVKFMMYCRVYATL